MKTIENYIQFAINNDFDLWDKAFYSNKSISKIVLNKNQELSYKWKIFYNRVYFYYKNNFLDDELLCKINLFELITSKEFIEAIARGLEWNWKYTLKYENTYLLYDLTREQALAIRNNKLEEFIDDLLPNK